MRVYKDIPYPNNTSDSDHQKLDLYIPSQLSLNEWIIFVHGGAWISNHRSQFHHVGNALNQKGYVCIVLGYQLSNKAQVEPESMWPRHLLDVQSGIDYVKSNEFMNLVYEKCPEIQSMSHRRIRLMGHSAGAQLVSLYALQSIQNRSDVQGVIGVEGIYDIPNLLNVFPGYQDWFLSKVFTPDDYETASPTRVAQTLTWNIPFLILHSSQDELVDVKQSTDFARAVNGTFEEISDGSSHDAVLSSTNLYDLIHDWISHCEQI